MNESNLPPRYRKPERIAHGGMGEIYRAEDAELDRTVAVKVLAEHLAGDDGIRARFTREARTAARLSGVVGAITIYDVGEHEGRPYIVMEYLEGGSLADRIAQGGAQPVGPVLDWLEDAAAALDTAHARGIVHRDVKPANLLLDEHDLVHVADFGVASGAGLTSVTDAGTVVGTAGYLSPEQARGERATPQSDRYALAVVAFELLTGVRPFERESPTAEALAHVSAPIPPASRYNPALPPAVDDVLAHALAKNPAYRFGSATEFVAALSAAFGQVHSTAVGGVPPVPRRRRLGTFLIPALLAAALLAGIAAAAILGGDDKPARTVVQPPQTVVQPPETVQKTVTLEGTTLTVTTAPETQPSAPTTQAPEPGASPAELNDQGYALMQQGNYQAALPLLEQAVAGLSGTGELAEAYASYNLAFTRFAVGSCDGVVELLDRSEQVQGERKEITRLRREAERSCED